MTRFWHRRICEAAFLLSAVIVLLYASPHIPSLQALSSFIIIGLPAAICAALTAVTSIVFYIWTPQKDIPEFSLAIFMLFAATTALLILGTGNTSSIFIALWMVISIFAGVYGITGYLAILTGTGAFIAAEYLEGHLSSETIVKAVLTGVIPLIASFLIWRARTKSESKATKDKAYKELANELTEVASKSEVVINAIGDGVMAIDSTGKIQLINPAAQQIIGWGKQDALSLNYLSVLHLVDDKGDDVNSAIDPVQQVLNTNQQIRNDELNVITKSGKKLATNIVVSPIGSPGSGVIVVFSDVTKQKAEEREQAEFISTASHEMRTPVASIEGYLGLALNPETAQIDAKARDFIQKAHESAQHLGRLFQDLLDVSKADDGRLSNNPKVVDVLLYTHDIVQGLTQKAKDKGLNLIFKPIPDDNEKHVTPVYSVNLDNDHIREVINNLTENAIKYTPQGEVIVDVTGTEDKVIVSITDSGIGIPVEDIPHLFQKFYRVDNEDTRQIGGTGLGLYLCRRLAETMGGRIWVESEYKKGSTFYLELPRITSQEAARLSDQQSLEAAKRAAAPAPVDFNHLPAQPVSVQPASTVPRGQSLTPEQIAAHVAKLKAMVQQQEQAQASVPVAVAIPHSVPAAPAAQQPTTPGTPVVPTMSPVLPPTRTAQMAVPPRPFHPGPQ